MTAGTPSAATARKPSLALRPLRLLTRPEPIEAVAEVPDGPPLRFRWRRALHEVIAAEGPERIEGAWWSEHGGPCAGLLPRRGQERSSFLAVPRRALPRPSARRGARRPGSCTGRLGEVRAANSLNPLPLWERVVRAKRGPGEGDMPKYRVEKFKRSQARHLRHTLTMPSGGSGNCFARGNSPKQNSAGKYRSGPGSWTSCRSNTCSSSRRTAVSTPRAHAIGFAMPTCGIVVSASCVSGTTTSLAIRAAYSSKFWKRPSSPPHPAAFGRDPLPQGERVSQCPRRVHALPRIRLRLEFLLPARSVASGGIDGAGARSGSPAWAYATAIRWPAWCARIWPSASRTCRCAITQARGSCSPTARRTFWPIRATVPPGDGFAACSRSAIFAPRRAMHPAARRPAGTQFWAGIGGDGR